MIASKNMARSTYLALQISVINAVEGKKLNQSFLAMLDNLHHHSEEIHQKTQTCLIQYWYTNNLCSPIAQIIQEKTLHKIISNQKLLFSEEFQHQEEVLQLEQQDWELLSIPDVQ